jgi:hypothetical protein
MIRFVIAVCAGLCSLALIACGSSSSTSASGNASGAGSPSG